MRIAVCDDNLHELEIFQAMLETAKKECDLVRAFSGGMQFLDYCEKRHPFDLVLLDVMMPLVSGQDVAGEIRRLFPDTVIVVLTGYERYAQEFYQYHVYDYLLKPPDPLKLSEILEHVRAQLNPYESLLVKVEGEYARIKPRHIYFVEIQGRMVTIHAVNRDYIFTGQLKKLLPNLIPYGFYQINRSTVINLDFVDGVAKKTNTVYLTASGGKTKALPIADGRTSDFMVKLTEHIDSINKRPGR